MLDENAIFEVTVRLSAPEMTDLIVALSQYEQHTTHIIVKSKDEGEKLLFRRVLKNAQSVKQKILDGKRIVLPEQQGQETDDGKLRLAD